MLVTAARRSAPRPVAVRARPVRRLDVRLDRALGEELDRLERVLEVLQPARRRGRSPARRPAGSRRRSSPSGNETKLRVESVAEDGSPRDFYSTAVAVTDPDLDLAGDRPRPGRARRLRGAARRDRPGAYVVRVIADAARVDAARADARARRADAGRVPAPGRERRVPRDAPLGDRRRGRSTLPAEPWIHDLETTTLVHRPLADCC